MKVAQLTIEMAANVARLQKDMAQAQRSVDSTMSKIQKSATLAMRSLGAFGVILSVNSFVNWVKGAIDAIDKLGKLSAATGIAVESLAGLDFAAKLSGTSLETVTQAANKLQLGLANNAAALNRIGITAKDPLEALIQLADVYAATEGQSNKAALGNLALGKSWQSLAGFLGQGGDAIKALIDEGSALSGVTTEASKNAEKFNDNLDRLKTSLNRVAVEIAGPVVKALSEVFIELEEGKKAAGGFIQAIFLLGSTNPFLSLEENVAKYRKEVEKLTERKEKYGELAFDAFGHNETLAKAIKRLTYFESLLAIEKRNTTDAMGQGTKGADAHVLAYLEMTKSADDLIEQMKLEFLLLGMTNDERTETIALRKLEEIGIRQETDAYLKYWNQINDLTNRIRIKRESIREAEAAASNAKREAEQYENLIKSIQNKIITMQIENETYFASNEARERAIFLRELEIVKIEDRNRLIAQYDEAAAIKKANDEHKKRIEQQLKQQEEYAQKMEKINDQIGQSLTDALMNGGMKARDFIVNMFKTMVLRPVLQPIIGAVTGAVTSLFAGSALAGGTGAAGATSMTQAGSLMGLVSAAKTAYEVVSGGFASVGTAASNLAATFMGQNLAVNAALIESGTAGVAGAALETSALATSQIAASVGMVAQYAAGIGAGVMAGQLISGQFKVGGSSYLATGGGAIIGAILGGPIGGAIGGAIGGLVNRAFGMGQEKVSRTGMELRPTIGGTDSLGFLETQQKGGWFRSDKWNRNIVDLGQKATDAFDQAAISIGSSVAGMTKSLGMSIDTINDFEMFTMVVDTLGKTEEEIQARITEVFSTFENALTDFLIPSIRQFELSSEETSSTILKRLYTSLVTVNQTFEILGYTLYEMNLQGADASQKLIDLFGGLENFSKSTSFYYENFYSAQEKVNFQTEQLTNILGALGLALPESNAGFRQLVESAQAAGDDQLFATLVQLAPAFNTLQVSLQQLGQTAESTFQTLESLVQLFQQNYDLATDATNKSFENLKKTLEVELEKSIKRAADNLSSALALIDEEIKAVTIVRDLSREAMSDIKNVFELLKKEIEDIAVSISVTEASARARSFISQALETAQRTGYLPLSGDLSTAIKQARGGMGAEQYSSEFEMRKDNLKLRNELIFLQEISGQQLSSTELQYKNSESQLLLLQERRNQAQILHDNEVAIAQAQHDDQLQAAQSQIDELRGIDNSILSLSDAIFQLSEAIEKERLAAFSLSAATGNTVGSVTATKEEQITQLYKTLLGRAPDQQGLSHWLSTGDSIQKIASDMMLSPEARGLAGFASGGYYSGGMAMVGERGPELIDFGNPGQVYSNDRLRSAMGGGDVASEIRGLREENRIQSRAMVSMQSRMTRLIERWDGDGLPTERYEDATA
jgi:hypothetical protein